MSEQIIDASVTLSVTYTDEIEIRNAIMLYTAGDSESSAIIANKHFGKDVNSAIFTEHCKADALKIVEWLQAKVPQETLDHVRTLLRGDPISHGRRSSKCGGKRGDVNVQYDYAVVEGGGLHLFLFVPGTDSLVAGYSGFESSQGDLMAALDMLDDGDDASGWEGKMENAQEQWDYMRQKGGTLFAHAIICHAEGGERTLHISRMGRMGMREFSLE